MLQYIGSSLDDIRLLLARCVQDSGCPDSYGPDSAEREFACAVVGQG